MTDLTEIKVIPLKMSSEAKSTHIFEIIIKKKLFSFLKTCQIKYRKEQFYI